jgi:hypothetical protein
MFLRPCFPISPPYLCLPPPSSSCRRADRRCPGEEPRQANPDPARANPEPRPRHGMPVRLAASTPPRRQTGAASSPPLKPGGLDHCGRKQRNRGKEEKREETPPCGPSPSAKGRKEKRKEDGPLSAQQTRSRAGLFVPCRPSQPVKPLAELALFASRAAYQYEPSLCWAACTLPAR